jgi:glycosyltransferase involved in cell wall biosynthesis
VKSDLRNIKITVLMPAFNAEHHIAAAIESVLSQTFTQFELLIINDGSTDRTVQIIQSFNDPRIRVHSQENTGIAAALNKGLQLANADIIARFDADDFCYPTRLEKQFNFLTVNTDHIIVGCSAAYTDMNEEYVFTYSPPGTTDHEIQRLKFSECPFIHSGVMFRKQAIVDAGGYNIHAHTFEDHLLWVKLLEHGKGHNLPDVLIRVRLHPGSMTMDEKWRSKEFTTIRRTAIKIGNIDAQGGQRLLQLMQQQNNDHTREGSYHALLAKKYLWDNHQPGKVRDNIRKLLQQRPMHLQGYLMWLLSFFPSTAVRRVYQLSKTGRT